VEHRCQILALLLSAALGAPGCGAPYTFSECKSDEDCDRPDRTGCAHGGCVCRDGGCVRPTRPGQCELPVPAFEPAEGTDVVVLGAIQTLSGDYAEASLDHRAALRTALAELNESGALGHRRLSIEWCDTRSDRDLAEEAFRYLVGGRRAPAIVGIESSDLLAWMARHVVPDGPLLMSHWATAETLSGAGRVDGAQPLVWRTAPADSYQAEALARIIDDACLKDLEVYVHPDDYGKGLWSRLQETACQERDDPCFRDTHFLPDPFENSAQAVRDAVEALVTDLKSLEPSRGGLVLIAFAENGQPFVEELARQEVDLPILASESVFVPGTLRAWQAGPDKPLVGANPGLSRGRGFRHYLEAFRAHGAGPERDPEEGFAAHAYDSLLLLGLAISTVPEGEPITGKALAAGLARLSDPEAPTVRPKSLAEGAALLRESPDATIDFEGASGSLDFELGTGEVPGTTIPPTFADEGTACPATDLQTGCSGDLTPRCRRGCEPLSGEGLEATEAEHRLPLGVLLPLSGPESPLGNSRLNALQIALRRLEPPTLSRTPVLHVCDSETDTHLALRLADELIEDRGVPAILGPASSAEARAAGARAAADGVLVMTPSATAAEVTAAGHRDGAPSLVWRTAPSDTHQAAQLAGLVASLACLKRLAVLYRGDVYGDGLRSDFLAGACPDGNCGFDAWFRQLPDQDDPEGISDVAGNLDALPAGTWRSEPGAGVPPEALLLLTFRGQGVAFLRALTAARLALTPPRRGLPVITTDTLLSPAALRETDVAAYDGLLLGTSPGTVEGPAYLDFSSAYAGAFPDEAPESFAAHTFDALLLLGLASETVPLDEAVTGERLVDGLQLLLGGGDAPEVRPDALTAAVARLRNRKPVDFEGASGSLDFSPTTGEIGTPPDFLVVRQGGVLVPYSQVRDGPDCDTALADLPCACGDGT